MIDPFVTKWFNVYLFEMIRLYNPCYLQNDSIETEKSIVYTLIHLKI